MKELMDRNILWKVPICARWMRLTGKIEGDCWCQKYTNSTRELLYIWWKKLLQSMNQKKK